MCYEVRRAEACVVCSVCVLLQYLVVCVSLLLQFLVFYYSTYYKAVRVCLLLQYLLQSVFELLLLFITAVPNAKLCAWGVCVYYCRTQYKAVCVGRGGILGDMCYERRRAEACVD